MARQLLEADRLLGLDFAPRSQADVAKGLATAPPAAASRSDASTPGDACHDKAAMLEQLRERHERECPYCTTSNATQTVFGEGNPHARLMFVGEAPGAEEDRTGRPFVGRAGQLLDKMIQAMGLKREEVYIANVLKRRPPNNATPTPMEADQCGPYLKEQIAIIRPEVIVTLGAPATKLLLETTDGISKLRGSWQTVRVGDRDIAVMPTFHPAYLLRSYTPENRQKVWSDLQKVMDRLGLKKP